MGGGRNGASRRRRRRTRGTLGRRPPEQPRPSRHRARARFGPRRPRRRDLRGGVPARYRADRRDDARCAQRHVRRRRFRSRRLRATPPGRPDVPRRVRRRFDAVHPARPRGDDRGDPCVQRISRRRRRSAASRDWLDTPPPDRDVSTSSTSTSIRRSISCVRGARSHRSPSVVASAVSGRGSASYFDDARLQQVFGSQALYAGLAPHQALAIQTVVTHTDTNGVFVPEGGMHSIATSLALAVERAGVKIRYRSPVTRLLRSAAGSINGVEVGGFHTTHGRRGRVQRRPPGRVSNPARRRRCTTGRAAWPLRALVPAVDRRGAR